MINLFILQNSSGLLNLVFPVLILGFMYFFMIRPQSKKQKEQAAFATALQKGDEVVTASGMIGRINKVDAHEVTLELDNKTFVRVIPQAISKEMTEQYKTATK